MSSVVRGRVILAMVLTLVAAYGILLWNDLPGKINKKPNAFAFGMPGQSPPSTASLVATKPLHSVLHNPFQCMTFSLNDYPYAPPKLLKDSRMTLGTSVGLLVFTPDLSSSTGYGLDASSEYAADEASNGDILLISNMSGLVAIKPDGSLLKVGERALGSKDFSLMWGGPLLRSENRILLPVYDSGGLTEFDVDYHLIYPSLTVFDQIATAQAVRMSSSQFGNPDPGHAHATLAWNGVVVVNQDFSITYYDHDLKQQWRYPGGLWPYERAILTSDDELLVAQKGGMLYKLDRTGKAIYSDSVGSSIECEPIAIDKENYCICSSKHLFIYNTLKNTLKETAINYLDRFHPCSSGDGTFWYYDGANLLRYSAGGKNTDWIATGLPRMDYGLFMGGPNRLIMGSSKNLYVITTNK